MVNTAKKIGMVILDHDALRSVARAGLDVTLLMAVTCKDWREAIEDTEGGVFDTRRVLLNLGDTALLTELYDALTLSVTNLKLYPRSCGLALKNPACWRCGFLVCEHV